jgi:hypothetical protein
MREMVAIRRSAKTRASVNKVTCSVFVPADADQQRQTTRTNGTRLHSTLGYRSPADFENDHHGKISKVA